jgi:amidase
MPDSWWTRRAFLELLGVLSALAAAGCRTSNSPIWAVMQPGSKSSDRLWRMGATDLADAIRTRSVSCAEVVEAHLERIHAVNGHCNAVTSILAESARREAVEADRSLVRGTSVGRLHGVPMTVKENVDLAGFATTEGVLALRSNVVATDSPHVHQLRRAGAIPIARTNLPDLGLRWHTESGLHGATRNPWNALLTPGGSSGGDAVAVATGMTPLGIGNDYGGSLRYPAQCCGVASIRPSRGRVPFHSAGQRSNEWGLTLQLFAVQGPIARSVRDLRLALDHMSGSDASDPSWVPAPLRGPTGASPMRVAVTLDPGGQGVDDNVAAGVQAAAAALADAGYVIEDADPPAVLEAAQLWNQLVAVELHTVAEQIAGIAAPEAVAFLNHFLAVNPRRDLNGYMRDLAARNSIMRDWNQFLARYPLILGPVSTQPPFAVGYDLTGVGAVRNMLESMRLVLSISLLGLPAVAMPAGIHLGMPRGVQLIGPMYREDLCLDAAEVVEQSLGVLTPIDPRI